MRQLTKSLLGGKILCRYIVHQAFTLHIRLINCGLSHVLNKDFATQNSSQDIEALRQEALCTLVMVEHTH